MLYYIFFILWKTTEQTQDTQQPTEDVSGGNSQTSVPILVNESSETKTSVVQDNQVVDV